MHIHGKSGLAEAMKSLSKTPKKHEGRITWDSEALERGTFEVIYNLTFTPPIDDYYKDGAIWHALNECARAEDFSTKFFIQKLRAYLEGLVSRQPRSFTAVTQVNAQTAARLPGNPFLVGFCPFPRKMPSLGVQLRAWGARYRKCICRRSVRPGFRA
jgi:hypothetical protein